jgi:hypothetical protein
VYADKHDQSCSCLTTEHYLDANRNCGTRPLTTMDWKTSEGAVTAEIWVSVPVNRAFRYFLIPVQRSSSFHVGLDLDSCCWTDAHFACSCETRDSILSANKACGSAALA